MTPDYMELPGELEKNRRMSLAKGGDGSQTLRGFMESAADGDSDLFDAMWRIWNLLQAFDDLLDESGVDDAMKESPMASFHDWVIDVLLNWSEPEQFKKTWDVLMARCGWIDAERICAAEKARKDFVKSARNNKFIRRHAFEIRAMLVSAMLRCLDGDSMAASEDAQQRALAPAVRCGDVDLFYHLIYLARGWAAAREWSANRDYDTMHDGQLLKGDK